MAHHAANTAAVAIPIFSVILHLPEVLTAIVSLLGIVWYSILIYDWVVKRLQQRAQTRQSTFRVTAALIEERHGPLDDGKA